MKKNTTAQNKEFSQNFQRDTYEEISLIDIAKIIVKRRKVFFITASIIILFSVFKSFTLFLGRPVSFVSLYKTATINQDKELEPILNTVDSIESYHKPRVIMDFAKEGKNAEQIDIKIDNPKGTLLVSLVSVISENEFDLMNEFHKAILDSLFADQQKKIEGRLNSIDEEIKFLSENLEKVEKEMKKEEARPNWKGQELVLVNFRDRVYTIEVKIKELERSKLTIKQGEILQVSQKKMQRVQSGAFLTLVIGFCLAIVLGIIVIFLVEFYFQVKKSIDEDGIE